MVGDHHAEAMLEREMATIANRIRRIAERAVLARHSKEVTDEINRLVDRLGR